MSCFYLGSYAASPNNESHFDLSIESRYLKEIQQFSYLKGLEIPYWGDGWTSFPSFDNWYAQQLAPQKEHIITTLPGIMRAQKKDKTIGLATLSLEGQKKAIQFYKNVNNKSKELIKTASVKISHMHIHSAPTHSVTSTMNQAEQFYQSLSELAQWDWGGIELVIEHCDSATDQHSVAKGFLPLSMEIEVLKQINKKYGKNWGILINWARSVLETRSTATPLEHIKECLKEKLLKGVFFSGVTINSPHYGNWQDSHVPFSFLTGEKGYPITWKDSLLSEMELLKVFNIIKNSSDIYWGIKFQIIPIDISLNHSLSLQKQALAFLYQHLTAE